MTKNEKTSARKGDYPEKREFRNRIETFIRGAALNKKDADHLCQLVMKRYDGSPNLDTAIPAAREELWNYYGKDVRDWVAGWIVPRIVKAVDEKRVLADALVYLNSEMPRYDPVSSKLRVDNFAHKIASTTFLEHYFPVIRNKLRAWCERKCDRGSGDASDVEGLTMLRISASLHKLKEDVNVEAFTMVHAKNALSYFYRGAGIEIQDPDEEWEDDLDGSDDMREYDDTNKVFLDALGLICRVRQPAERTICFLFKYILDIPPRNLVLQLSGRKLGDLLIDLEREVIEATDSDKSAISALLEPLKLRLKEDGGRYAERALDVFLPAPFDQKTWADHVARWIRDFRRPLVKEVALLDNGPLYEWLQGK